MHDVAIDGHGDGIVETGAVVERCRSALRGEIGERYLRADATGQRDVWAEDTAKKNTWQSESLQPNRVALENHLTCAIPVAHVCPSVAPNQIWTPLARATL
jgi:hypothetical protein